MIQDAVSLFFQPRPEGFARASAARVNCRRVCAITEARLVGLSKMECTAPIIISIAVPNGMDIACQISAGKIYTR